MCLEATSQRNVDLPFTIHYLNMNYRILGSTGLKVSELCLGTMTFGENFYGIAVVKQAGANEMVARALDASINFFDTADVFRSMFFVVLT
jgi:predicted aldo/keto reductase-like oxidoreductase